jgi:hypothetical protein
MSVVARRSERRLAAISDGRALDDPTVRSGEADAASLVTFDRPAPLVHESMVSWAQGEQVLELGGAASTPVLEVMGIEVEPIAASGKGATAIAHQQRSTDGRRDGAPAAPHVEQLTASTELCHRHRAIAAEPLEGLATEPVAGLVEGSATARLGLALRLEPQVDQQLCALAAARALRLGGAAQKATCDVRQRLGSVAVALLVTVARVHLECFFRGRIAAVVCSQLPSPLPQRPSASSKRRIMALSLWVAALMAIASEAIRSPSLAIAFGSLGFMTHYTPRFFRLSARR